MKKILISFIQVLQQIKSDPMLFAACFTPLTAGLLIKHGIPLLEKGVQIPLSDYYPVFDLFLSVMAPVLLCFAFAMITLEEIDEKAARYLSITPLGKIGYMVSRLCLPALLSMLIGFTVLLFFSLSKLTLLMKISLSLLGAVQAVIVSLMIITLSSNKLEGMAVTKLATLTLLGIPIPFFVNGRLQFALGFLPSFWTAKFVETGSFAFLIPAFGAAALWCGFLGRRFISKLAE